MKFKNKWNEANQFQKKKKKKKTWNNKGHIHTINEIISNSKISIIKSINYFFLKKMRHLQTNNKITIKNKINQLFFKKNNNNN